MSAVNNMAESSSLYSDYRFSSDMGASSDDDDFVSSASTTSAASEERSGGKKPLQRDVTMSNTHGSDDLQSSTCSFSGGSTAGNSSEAMSLAIRTGNLHLAAEKPVENNKPLLLLDLPMDVMQEIVKEVCTGHRSNLIPTCLILICSFLVR